MFEANDKLMVNFEKYRKKALDTYAPSRENWLPPDQALYSPKMIFNLSDKEAQDLRFKAIKYAFLHHYSKSPFYNRFCKELEVKPDDIILEKDYIKIPLLSDILFKDHPSTGREFVDWLQKIYVGNLPKIQNLDDRADYDNIIDAYQKENVTLVFSSGTSGSFSFVPRDRITWNRQMYVCSNIFEMSPFNFQSPKSTIIWLGPNPKMTHMYIGRLTMMLFDLFNHVDIHFGIDRELTTKAIGLLMGTSKGVSGKVKTSLIRPFIAYEESKIMGKLIDVLDNADKNKCEIGIGGAPFFIDMFLSKIEEKGLKFNIEKGMVVTAGGWKRFSGAEIPEEKFRDRINKILGIPQSNCRDIYGMVECNALNVSCEGHYKHIPQSVIYPMVLDDESEPVAFGEEGRFAFIDPLANSYPGFIMTNDKVKILEHCPVCDRSGPVICGNISRLGGMQDRGCGAALAKMFSEEISKTKELK